MLFPLPNSHDTVRENKLFSNLLYSDNVYRASFERIVAVWCEYSVAGYGKAQVGYLFPNFRRNVLPLLLQRTQLFDRSACLSVRDSKCSKWWNSNIINTCHY